MDFHSWMGPLEIVSYCLNIGLVSAKYRFMLQKTPNVK